MPSGSKARTVAPSPWRAGTITSDGLSRMSSVPGLKVTPSTAMVLPATEPPQASVILLTMRRFLPSLTPTTASTMRRCVLCCSPVRKQRQRVLGEAGAAIARAGMQELLADAAVQTHALGDLLHVGADALAQVGHLVDEGDLGREEGVGRVLDQLGGLERGEQDRGLDQVQAAGSSATAPRAPGRSRRRRRRGRGAGSPRSPSPRAGTRGSRRCRSAGRGAGWRRSSAACGRCRPARSTWSPPGSGA